jgi:hypothetical protein
VFILKKKKEVKMQKLLNVIMWSVGVLVSLAVGNGMIAGTLSVPLIPSIVTEIAGWLVVVGAVLGVIMAVIKAVK